MIDWITLSREMKSIAEAGLRYGENSYDHERYKRIHELASMPMQAVVPSFVWPCEFGYATPKVDVRAGVINEHQQILLVQEAQSGLWTLPGGWADLNLSPAENVVKEVQEEAGLGVVVTKLLACWDKEKHGHPRQIEHVYKLIFACQLNGERFTRHHETLDARFFSYDDLPALCPHRASVEYIDLIYQHAQDVELRTSFD